LFGGGDSTRVGMLRVAGATFGGGGFVMITFRLGVDGSLTPWPRAPAGSSSPAIIKPKSSLM